MKIIEALKEVKALRKKVLDLTNKINQNSAHREDQPTEYKDPATEVQSWQTQVHAATQRIEELLLKISKTNLETMISIKIGDNMITKSIAGWVYRVRELAEIDMRAWAVLSNKGIRTMVDPKDQEKVYKVILNYDAKLRDKKVEEYATEPGLISTRLETINATTDLIE